MEKPGQQEVLIVSRKQVTKTLQSNKEVWVLITEWKASSVFQREVKRRKTELLDI